ncbi:MAG TPA: hypothetical protein PKM65_07070 [Spirochaetota bacterium]|nr:hypothetical protein [Spirochaetota bacterium]HNT09882.1 hypothetical protein [Spirochaetota bacterium]
MIAQQKHAMHHITAGCLAAILALPCFTSCKGKLDEAAESFLDRRPTLFRIVSDRSLVRSDTDEPAPIAAISGTVPTHTFGGTYPAGGGIVPTGSGIVATGSGIVPTGSGITPPLGGLTGDNATAPFVANISVSFSFPEIAEKAAKILAPFAAIPFSFTGFTVDRSQITATADFIARAVAGNGRETDYLDSNAIPAAYYRVRQVSNLSGTADINKTVDYVECNGKLYFSGYLSGNTKLCCYDPAANTITQISNIRAGAHDDPMGFGTDNRLMAVNNRVVFVANNTNGVAKLFSYNTLTDTVTQVSDTRNSSTISDSIAAGLVHGTRVYFRANNASGRTKLYCYDTANDTLVQVSNTRNNNAEHDGPVPQAMYNGKLMFTAANSSGTGYTKLYAYDPSVGTVTLISNIRNNQSVEDVNSMVPHVVYSGKLYFSGINANGEKLYCYDDTAQTITQISDTRNGLSDFCKNLIVVGEELFFKSTTVSSGEKLFSYNATSGRLMQVSNCRNSESITDNISQLTVYNGRLYFSAWNPSESSKLFCYDPSSGSLTVLSNTRTDPAMNDSPESLFVHTNRLFFGSSNVSNWRKLYCYDDRDGKLSQVVDVNSTASDDPDGVCMLNGKLYFRALKDGFTKLYVLY